MCKRPGPIMISFYEPLYEPGLIETNFCKSDLIATNFCRPGLIMTSFVYFAAISCGIINNAEKPVN